MTSPTGRNGVARPAGSTSSVDDVFDQPASEEVLAGARLAAGKNFHEVLLHLQNIEKQFIWYEKRLLEKDRRIESLEQSLDASAESMYELLEEKKYADRRIIELETALDIYSD